MSCEQPDEDLPPELMLDVIERSLDNIPDDTKPQARQETIAMFAGIFEQAGLPVPKWVRLSQTVWGSPGSGIR